MVARGGERVATLGVFLADDILLRMIWKVVISQIVAMVMLAIAVLMLRDLIRHRDTVPRSYWLYPLVPLAIMLWGVWLLMVESLRDFLEIK